MPLPHPGSLQHLLLCPALLEAWGAPHTAPGRRAALDGAAGAMAAGGRRRRPLRYQSLAALVEDSQWPFLFLVSDFSYAADDYDGEGHEEQKGPPEGSETMPYIDESPTMSPQLSARSQSGGESVSPTPPEGLAPGVGPPTFPSGFAESWAREDGTVASLGRWQGWWDLGADVGVVGVLVSLTLGPIHRAPTCGSVPCPGCPL